MKAALCQLAVSASPTASSDVAVLAQQGFPTVPAWHVPPHASWLPSMGLSAMLGICHHPTAPAHGDIPVMHLQQSGGGCWPPSRCGVGSGSLSYEHLQPFIHNPSSRGWISKHCSTSLPQITTSQRPPHPAQPHNPRAVPTLREGPGDKLVEEADHPAQLPLAALLAVAHGSGSQHRGGTQAQSRHKAPSSPVRCPGQDRAFVSCSEPAGIGGRKSPMGKAVQRGSLRARLAGRQAGRQAGSLALG